MPSLIYKSCASQFAITDPGPSQRTSPAEDPRPVPGSTSLYPPFPLAWEDLSYPSHSANFFVSLQRLTSDFYPEFLHHSACRPLLSKLSLLAKRPCLNLGLYLIVDAYSVVSSIFPVVDVPIKIISIPADSIYWVLTLSDILFTSSQ